MAIPPDFRSLNRNITSNALAFSSFKRILARGAGSRVGAGLPNPTPTVTPTISVSPSVTPTTTITPTNSPTNTPTITPTITRTPTLTPTVTVTRTCTPTWTLAPINVDAVFNADPAQPAWDSMISTDIYGWEAPFVQPGIAFFFNGAVPFGPDFFDQTYTSVYLDGDVLIPQLAFNSSRLSNPANIVIGVALTNTPDGPGFFENGPYNNSIIAYANLTEGRTDLYSGQLRP